MIKSSSTLFVVLIQWSVSAQNWCPPGAEWSHTIYHQGSITSPPLHGFNITRYIGDTLLGGENAQIMDRWEYRQTQIVPPEYSVQHWSPFFTRSDTDMVYLWSEIDQTFDTLYWFSAQAGDHWTLPGMPNIDHQVNSTDVVDIDGAMLRRLIVIPQGSTQMDTIMERIGSFRYFMIPSFSQLLSPNGYIERLRCYRDDDIEFTRIPGNDCAYNLQIADRTALQFGLHPNPGADHFILRLAAGEHNVSIIDQLGRTVMQFDRISDQAIIDTSLLSEEPISFK